jgi:cyanophycinase
MGAEHRVQLHPVPDRITTSLRRATARVLESQLEQLMKRWSLLLWMCLSLSLAQAGAAKLPYTYARLGNAADGTAASLQGGTVLMGGSTDVDAAFQWMCGRSKGGDFLVIRATGTDAYNPYIQRLCADGNAAANSVATLIIPTKTAAQDGRVSDLIMKAEAIWIAGGDQSDYINLWKGTAVQTALNTRIAAGVPVGGTSAGLNVLTQFIYSAQASKGATSSQALLDPYHRTLSFERDFSVVPVLAGTIGDPHFSARDRMGRDLAFLCRVYQLGWSAMPKAIAVDEETALLIDTARSATVVGKGSVYFLQAPSGGPQTCQPGTPLTYLNVGVYRIEKAGSFNLGNWSGTAGLGYTVSADRGALTSSTGSIY